MKQEQIWRHFQNRHQESFAAAAPRLRHLCGRFAPGDRVLDIGIGAGTFAELAVARRLEVWCLDPDAEAVAALADRLGLGERALVGVSDAIPLPDASLDGVVMSEVLEHLDDRQLSATLAEVARVLAPGGLFLGTVPDNEDLVANEVACPCCGEVFHRWGHQQRFDQARLAAALAGAGFADVQVHSRLFPSWRHLNWKGKLSWCLRLMVHRLGSASSHAKLVFAARQ